MQHFENILVRKRACRDRPIRRGKQGGSDHHVYPWPFGFQLLADGQCRWWCHTQNLDTGLAGTESAQVQTDLQLIWRG